MKSCVVISTYNGEKFILEQLESIRNQSRSVDAVFISDDCSNDNTVNIVNEYIKNNQLNNWIITKNDTNVGWKENYKNLIISVPLEYEIIFFCDQDDIWHKNKVKNMIDVFEQNKELGLLVSDLDIKYENENIKKINYPKLGNKSNEYIKFIPYNLNLRRPGCVFAVRNEFAKDCFNNYYDKKFAHDKLLWMYAFCKKNIMYINEQLITFRRFSVSTSGMDKGTNRYLYKKNDSLEMIEFLKMCQKINNIDINTKNMLNNALKLENNRQKFFQNKNVIYWLSCLRYLNYYQNYKMWPGDLYFRLTYKD